MGTTDTIFTLVTMVKIAIIVFSTTMFRAVNILSLQIMVTGRISIKFVMT
jgi:hypothetical protein